MNLRIDKYNRLKWFIHKPTKTNILYEYLVYNSLQAGEVSRIEATIFHTGEKFSGLFTDTYPKLIAALEDAMRTLTGTEDMSDKVTAITTAYHKETRPVLVKRTWLPLPGEEN